MEGMTLVGWVPILSEEGAVETLGKALDILVRTQSASSMAVPGAVTQEVTGDQVRTYAYALIAEVVELLDDKSGGLSWKPWARARGVDAAYVTNEAADLLAFLGLILRYVCLAAKVSPGAIAHTYAEKTRVNIDRFAGKYEGYGV